jgi:hypothetical protein
LPFLHSGPLSPAFLAEDFFPQAKIEIETGRPGCPPAGPFLLWMPKDRGKRFEINDGKITLAFSICFLLRKCK